MKYLSISFCAFLLIFSLTNCSGNIVENKQHRVLDSSTYASAQPSDFDGPWADDFAKLVVGSQVSAADYVYSVVKDSKITDQELQESQNKFAKCIKDYGYNVRFGSSDTLSGYLIIDPESSNDGNIGITQNADNAELKCDGGQTNYSSIASLYYEILWNPQKEDLSNYSA